MKKLLALLLVFCLIFQTTVFADETDPENDPSAGYSCYVTFDPVHQSDMGSEPFSQEYWAGGSYGSLPFIYGFNELFLGWYTEPEGGQKVTETDICNDPGTLYAHWARSFMIYFQCDADASVMESQREVADGEPYGALPAAVSGNRPFIGWVNGTDFVTANTTHAAADGDVYLTAVFAHEHALEHYAAKAPAVGESGNLEYWYCPTCQMYFLDEYGSGIDVTWSEIELPAIDPTTVAHTHTWKVNGWDWGTESSSSSYNVTARLRCSFCDKEVFVPAIYSIDAVPGDDACHTCTISGTDPEGNTFTKTENEGHYFHDPGYSANDTWEIDEKNLTATLVLTCSECGYKLRKAATVTEQHSTQVDCTEVTEYLAEAQITWPGNSTPTTYSESFSVTKQSDHQWMPSWIWSSNSDSTWEATVDFTCGRCGTIGSSAVPVSVSKAVLTGDDNICCRYTATAADPAGKTVTDTYEIRHPYNSWPVWDIDEENLTATATFTCPDCGHTLSFPADVTLTSTYSNVPGIKTTEYTVSLQHTWSSDLSPKEYSTSFTKDEADTGYYNGTCGDNAYYRVEGSTLIIEGNGTVTAPSSWKDLKSTITSIVIPENMSDEGITGIDSSAFSGFTNVTSVSLPLSLRSIGSSSFYGCSSLTSIELLQGLTSIGSMAFFMTGISILEIPPTVTTIARDVIGDPDKINAIYRLCFTGDRPAFTDTWIGNYQTKVYYLSGNTTWNGFAKDEPYVLSVTPYDGNPLTAIPVDDISACTVQLQEMWAMRILTDDLTYTGEAFEPVFSLREVNGNHYGLLRKDIDYNYSYENNVNAGTAVINIGGNGLYTGNLTYEFTIRPASISSATVAAISDKSYTGTAIKPAPAVTVNGKKLKKGTDYTLSYKNNTNAGTATVTIKGKGNYTGTKTATFTIKPSKTALELSSNAKVTKSYSAKAQYVQIDAADKFGRKLTFKSGNSKVKVSSLGKVTLPAKFVGVVKITVQTPKDDNTTNQVSSAVTITVKPQKATLSSVKNSAAKTAKITWKKAAAGTGYEIQYATNKNFTGAKTITVKKIGTTSYTLKKLTKGKTYYFRIRVYTTTGKKTAGAWSSVKSVKIAK